MQLKKIKLSGFKSFVDPTTVPIPGQLVAIVGPNGCGKSNIIDAVCWVMGESSAKYLRGESLTDVIFNGSGTRKPVGQASVELVFDNQDGSLGGEYASYSEISIRRMINRDSESSYFLNGTRVRRKDIIDIFLGTGLGPRSYSIIGQNMISRLIEAKPDEMRIYLEEAAGVSRYKERRRETQNRIQHTRENMARLDDVRTELDKQLGTLKRQAAAAERFRTLKQEERTLRAEWLASQWRALDGRRVQFALQIQQQETGLEAKLAETGEVDLAIEKKREIGRVSGEAFQAIQRRYYAAGNEITRIEQTVQHTKERQRQWEADRSQVEQDLAGVQETLDSLQGDLDGLTAESTRLEPALRDAEQTGTAAREATRAAEEAMQGWQGQWDGFHERQAHAMQTAEVEQTRITHLEQKLASVRQRKSQLEQAQAEIDFASLEQEVRQLSDLAAEMHAMNAKQTAALHAIRQQVSDEQMAGQEMSRALDQVRNQIQPLRGRQASLEALQQTALGQRNHPVAEWLAKHALDQLPRLAQLIEVESGFELALEKVLGVHLQAICVDALSDVTEFMDALTSGTLSVFATSTAMATTASSGTRGTRLLDKVKSKWPLDALLAHIFVADTRDEALALCKTLAPHESVVTKDGFWLNPVWLRVSRDENPADGVFQREQELKQLALQITTLETEQASLQLNLDHHRERMRTLEDERDQLQKTVNEAHAKIAQTEAQANIKQARLTELNARSEQIRQELTEGARQDEETGAELTRSRALWHEAMSELEALADQRESLERERDRLRERQESTRQKLGEARELYHQLEMRRQTIQSQRGSLQQTLTRMQTQQHTLTERRALLEQEVSAEDALIALEEALVKALGERMHIEEEVNAARQTIEQVEAEIRALEHQRQQIEREIAKVRDMLETSRLENQGLKVKAETIEEQFRETQLNLEETLKTLLDEHSPEILHQQLEQVTLRITRLGPINLVAIEEYATCSERKEYLDKQHADLLEGLTTLENAIAKIDRETRARFRETFDRVNQRFQELFPTIFGGGKANLELTGENLLDAGITVMACPPGKRNSTIHLLSGGEKAMTAIALVFSIFHLNPAPFCLLDEVDAPLDDANIGRFCQLVQTMADKTQFIFISHNKLAIEMGQYLMGVTMHEPGVSRLVSVNVEEAVSLAGA